MEAALNGTDRLRPEWITWASASWDDGSQSLQEPTTNLVISCG